MLNRLKYHPDGIIFIDVEYSASYETFDSHCTELALPNPIIENQFFEYKPGVGTDTISTTGSHAENDGEINEAYQSIIDAKADFLALLNPTPVEPSLIDLIPQIRKDFEKETIAIDGADFIGDSATRASLSETIRFLEELGEQAPISITWKAENGFFDLSLLELKNIAIEIGTRRQKAFVAEKTVEIEVNSDNITTIEEANSLFTATINTL